MTEIRMILFLVCAVFASEPARATGADRPQHITPAHVYARVSALNTELEVLRYYMGKPRNEQPQLEVANAEPREVYFQAQSMFLNADRLCWEHLREHVESPERQLSDIQPVDVFAVVDAAMACLLRVKLSMGIEDLPVAIEIDPSKTPTDVFQAVVQANRQLNLLLDRRVAPSDVFEEVTQGVGYAARLLEQFPESMTIPNPPPYETGKRPSDVYRRLVDCFARVKHLASMSGLTVLDLQVSDRQINEAEPSDVLHMASLVVSELAYLHSQMESPIPPSAVFYVGRKVPSDVYQRAGLLELQLVEMESWLNELSEPRNGEGAAR